MNSWSNTVKILKMFTKNTEIKEENWTNKEFIGVNSSNLEEKGEKRKYPPFSNWYFS